jgi:hypothetical protein
MRRLSTIAVPISLLVFAPFVRYRQDSAEWKKLRRENTGNGKMGMRLRILRKPGQSGELKMAMKWMTT